MSATPSGVSPAAGDRPATRWKMDAPCADCPFSTSAKGKALATSLRPGRITEITQALRRGEHFTCHKTTHATGNGTNLICAGAMAWQHERGLSSQYERICERLDSRAVRSSEGSET